MRFWSTKLAVVCMWFGLLGCGPAEPEGVATCEPPQPPEDCVIYEGVKTFNRIEDFKLFCDTPCSRVEGYLSVGPVPNLLDLRALRNVRHVEKDLDIDGGPAMRELRGLEELETIGGDLNVNSQGLESLDGFDSLREIGGYLRIKESQKLKSTGDFPKLEKVRRIEMSDNFELNEIGDFPRLEELEAISIQGTRSLESLDGFVAVKRLEGGLGLRNNRELKRLDGLPKLGEVGGLGIEFNPRLRQCTIDDFLERIGPVGSSTVENNGPTCE